MLSDFLNDLHIRRINYPLSIKQKKEISDSDLNFIKKRLDKARAVAHDEVFGK